MKKQRGGKRLGAGRKPIPDKKVQLTIYVKTARLEKLGREKIRQVCDESINEAFLSSI